LVPLDGSDLAAEAIPWAEALARQLAATIELVSVIELDLPSQSSETAASFNWHSSLSAGADTAMPHDPAEAARIRSMEEVLNQVHASREWSGPVDVTVLTGDPATAIAEHATRVGASLIVMVTHARRGPARVLLGSVAGEVINHTAVPVFAMRPGLPPPVSLPQRVLVPLDGSELSDAVLPAVTPLAQQLGWSLVLFTAGELPPPTVPVQGAEIPLGLAPATPPAQLEEHLERTAANLRSTGVSVEIRVAFGSPVDTILQAAHEAECGLIAMSTHGRRGPARWVRGSVTDAVLHRADTPVLVVRPQHAPAKDAEGVA
jgi:nucleotide-binding universal stress UspA family protein